MFLKGFRSESRKFWYADGDVLVRVKTTLYLLHGWVLSGHSKLFEREALEELDSRETYQNVAIFSLPECDDVQDWERLLAAVYKPEELGRLEQAVPSDKLFSLIPFAKALKFHTIVMLCVKRLATELPRTLDAFDGAYTMPMTGSMLKSTAYISSKTKLFYTINWLLEHKQEHFLGCAYLLALMEASKHEIAQGVCSPDGSHVQLHTNAQKVLLFARAEIDLMLWSDTNSFLGALRHYSTRGPDLLQIRLSVLSSKEDVDMRRWLISSHREGEWFADAFEYGGSGCKKAKMLLDQKRKDFWANVPMLVQLGETWNDLTVTDISIDSSSIGTA